MRILLTVADPISAQAVDLVLDAEAATPLGEVTAVLARRLRPRADQFARLYLGGRLLDPSQALADSPLIDGCLLSLDDPRLSLPPEPSGLVEFRVVAGPGAGTVHRLGVGEVTIGSGPGCAVVIPVAGIAPVAAVALVGRSGQVDVRVPAGSEGAQLDREPLAAQPVTWPVGGELQVGPVLIEVAPPSRPDAALLRSADGPWLDYNRPPRLLPPHPQTRFRLPPPPPPPGKASLPLLGALAPALLGALMALMMRQPTFLLMAAMTPVMLFSNAISGRRQGKKSHRRLLHDYRRNVAAIEADADQALVSERHARRYASPDAAELLLTATGPRARLWERRRRDPDHLLIRIGTCDQSSEVVVEDPEQLEHKRHVQRTARDVPVSVRLSECGVLGLAGPGERPREVAAWAIGQLAVLQSPRDLRIWVLTDPAGVSRWRWAAWLPHVRPAPGSGIEAAALIGSDTESLARRVAELSQLVQARRKVAEGRDIDFDDADVIVVLDGARRLRALPGVVSLLKDGPAVGVYCVCLDSDQRLLPEECGAVVDCSPTWLDLRQQRAAGVKSIRPDLVPAAWFQRIARAIAPIRDVSDDGDGAALPSAARLLDVLGLEPPTPDAVLARWLVAGASTEAVIGASIDGPFVIDLRRDGPHGLIAGTTGSGKSELLQTIVAALAVANRPDAMTFVLIDYKGGAAFKDCVALPHTVGMVTDLDPHLVERALTSLAAELTRREHILAAAGAKDIEDYADYARRGDELTPLPRLLIVIDEFASMARELPDFVTGLVNIAQRGRSLGIHLILATQRPSGVVSPEIRANTNLRIALRVTDPAESSDVIDGPDAARISKATPGRAFVRLGHASLVPFQAGRVGGRRPGLRVEQARRPPWLARLDWSQLGRPVPSPPEPAEAEELAATDLSVLVEAISTADDKLGRPPPHSPWLPALPALLSTDDLTAGPADGGGATWPGSPRIAPIPYALEDWPAEQTRRVASLDLATFGHLYLVGAPRSGRSQALRTIAAMVAQRVSTADVHLFGIDCGGGALLPLSKLPHCGAVVQRSQVERATRLIGRLRAELRDRQEVLGRGGFADLTEQRAAVATEDRLPHLLVLVDRWEGFVPTLGEVDGGALTEQLWMMLREGASVGIHLIVTGDRTLLTGKASTLTENKLLMRLTDRSDYGQTGLNPKKMPETIGVGRAFRGDSGIETQLAVLGRDASGPAQAELIAVIGAAATRRDAAVPRSRRPLRVDSLPGRLAFDDAWDLRPAGAGPLWGLVGLGGDELLAVGADLATGPPTFVVAGPAKSGRSTLLVSMAASFLRGGVDLVLVTPRPSPLRLLAREAGVRAVLDDDDLTEDRLAELIGTDDETLVLIIDDAELTKDVPAKDWLRRFARTAGDHRKAVIIAGEAGEVASGFSGWQLELKKNRNGALLSPQGTNDCDLIGVRVPRSAVGEPVLPGRAMVHLGDGELITVQVPLPAP